MMKRLIIGVTSCFIFFSGFAQSILPTERLAEVKKSLSQPAYAVAYQELLRQADGILGQEPFSVVMKEQLPVSGDKQDYMSLARYYWPDKHKVDGKPYVRRDGVSNPELNQYDRNRLGRMANGVKTLTLAWYFSGDEKYARKATHLLSTWFVDKDTRMNPNLKFAQVIKGRYQDQGRCYGLIDGYSFVEVLEAVRLLEHSEAFTSKDSKQLKNWFSQFLEWYLNSEQGIEEKKQKNNHSIAYDVQIVSYAMYVGNRKLAEQYIKAFPEHRLMAQIEEDGKQPHELTRTLAFSYSIYNLQHIIDMMQLANRFGIDIANAQVAEGRFYKAADFLSAYLGKEEIAWPYQQISGWDGKQQELCECLYRMYLLDTSRVDYLKLYKAYHKVNRKDLFHLLYWQPDEVDQAYAFAEVQLKYALECAEKAKKDAPGKKIVSPRSVEKDGRLRMVTPRDWCSGFFPGSLWQMYAYTGDSFWREEAISYTWPLEELKKFKGTHDLGFMMFCSFGQAYQLTGERSYKDVAVQAARSLSSRYNPKLKVIRSWDWHGKQWQYPVIIDNMMNLELLFWATQVTGDSSYYKIAENHANSTLKNHFRPEGSSYHVVDYDTVNGQVRLKCTHQGIADESVWSRGQGWGLYGFTMCYRFTRNAEYLALAEKIADFFFSQPNLPEDYIPYWDMKDPAIPDCPRDASAASLMASGLYELATYVTPEKARQYRKIADRILHSLQQYYQPEPKTTYGFLLLHSTGNYPSHDEIDVPISYADYYYLEALARKTKFER